MYRGLKVLPTCSWRKTNWEKNIKNKISKIITRGVLLHKSRKEATTVKNRYFFRRCHNCKLCIHLPCVTCDVKDIVKNIKQWFFSKKIILSFEKIIILCLTFTIHKEKDSAFIFDSIYIEIVFAIYYVHTFLRFLTLDHFGRPISFHLMRSLVNNETYRPK